MTRGEAMPYEPFKTPVLRNRSDAAIQIRLFGRQLRVAGYGQVNLDTEPGALGCVAYINRVFARLERAYEIEFVSEHVPVSIDSGNQFSETLSRLLSDEKKTAAKLKAKAKTKAKTRTKAKTKKKTKAKTILPGIRRETTGSKR